MTPRVGQSLSLRRRRATAVLLSPLAALAVGPGHGWAQSVPPPIRLGWVGTQPPASQIYNLAFIARLAELGYAQGRNLSIEFRSTTGRADLPSIGAELAALGCDAYFAPGPEAGLLALKGQAGERPIVIVSNDYDPVATGHVASMARPGGRITGVSQLQLELPAKRLEILKELLPRLRRVGVLADSSTVGQLKVSREAAASLGLELVVHTFARQPYDLKTGFAAFAAARVEALVVLTSGYFVPHRQQIADAALAARLPAIFNNWIWVQAGGLMSYGPDFSVSYRRAAEMLVRILAGAKPADMPIEQPTAVEMMLNLKTARALALTVPRTIHLRADRVIE